MSLLEYTYSMHIQGNFSIVIAWGTKIVLKIFCINFSVTKIRKDVFCVIAIYTIESVECFIKFCVHADFDVLTLKTNIL